MEDFNLNELQPYIFILVGIAILIASILKKSTRSNLKESGFKAEGIVYAKGYSDDNSDNTSNLKDKITVRFVTHKNEWITGDIKQDFAVFFTNQYKEGQSLDVYYDPENPSIFFVDTKQYETVGRILFATIGLVFCAVGLFQLF